MGREHIASPEALCTLWILAMSSLVLATPGNATDCSSMATSIFSDVYNLEETPWIARLFEHSEKRGS